MRYGKITAGSRRLASTGGDVDLRMKRVDLRMKRVDLRMKRCARHYTVLKNITTQPLTSLACQWQKERADEIRANRAYQSMLVAYDRGSVGTNLPYRGFVLFRRVVLPAWPRGAHRRLLQQ